MRLLTNARRLARHKGPAGSIAEIVRQGAQSRQVALAALALLVAATVLTYWQMRVQEVGTAVADGRLVAVAVPEQLVPPATAWRASAPPPATASSAAASSTPAAPRMAGVRWRRVLEQLNDKRHAAWLRGEPRLLREVYVPRSRPLALDREALHNYLSRGLRVHGVRLRFARLHVVARGPGLVTLGVVDRLHEMTATAPDGEILPLPLDQPTRHHIVLRSLDGSWLIAAVSTR